MSVKSDLRNVKLEDIGLRGLRGNNSIFINPSLCPYYSMLWSKSKRLLGLVKNKNFYISSGKIKIKLQGNTNQLVITYVKFFKTDTYTLIWIEVSGYFKLLTEILNIIFLITRSVRRSVTTMHSYYGLFKDFYHGFRVQLSCFMLKPTSLFPVEIKLTGILEKPV